MFMSEDDKPFIADVGFTLMILIVILVISILSAYFVPRGSINANQSKSDSTSS